MEAMEEDEEEEGEEEAEKEDYEEDDIDKDAEEEDENMEDEASIDSAVENKRKKEKKEKKEKKDKKEKKGKKDKKEKKEKKEKKGKKDKKEKKGKKDKKEMKQKNEENKKEKPEDPSDSDDSDGSDLVLESQQIQLVPRRFFRRPGPSQQLPYEVSATSSFTALTEKPSVPTVENDEKDDFRRNESAMKNIAVFIFIYFHLSSYVFMSFFFIYPHTLNYVMLPCLHISSRSNVCVCSSFSGANVTGLVHPLESNIFIFSGMLDI